MSSESNLSCTSSGASDTPKRSNNVLAVVTCFLILCFMCGICLVFRYFNPLSHEVAIQGTSERDIYASCAFPYSDTDDKAYIIKAGTCIVHAGERIEGNAARRLEAYCRQVRLHSSSNQRIMDYLRTLGVVAIMLACFLFCLNSLRPHFFRHTSYVSLCILLTFLHIALVTGCELWMKSYGIGNMVHALSMLPLCLVPAIALHLLGTRMCVCLALLLTSLTSLMVSGYLQLPVFQYSLVCSLLGIVIYRNVHWNKQLLFRGFLLYLSMLGMSFVTLWHWDMNEAWVELREFGQSIVQLSFWSTWNWKGILGELYLSAFWRTLLVLIGVNVLVTTVLMLILPKLFELIFDVVSPVSLQSLHSREHPLLLRLSKEAKGTYEHSMNVGQMAGDAAEAIGADMMLAKMCGHFHDIGKLADPGCFAENIFPEESPHYHLTPHESSARIRAHVKNGVELARKYHLQRPLIEAISSHHGNDLVAFFYRKALREAEEQGKPMPDEKDFRYQAPLPHRREAVIVEIADICEAASRAELAKLEKVDRATVKQFVDKLVMAKLQHSQFAEADLTLAELTKVCESMVDSLCGKYHQRPSYSQDMNDAPAGVSNDGDGAALSNIGGTVPFESKSAQPSRPDVIAETVFGASSSAVSVVAGLVQQESSAVSVEPSVKREEIQSSGQEEETPK